MDKQDNPSQKRPPAQGPVPPTVQAELRPGETLLWAGQPAQGLILRPTDTYFVPISVLVAAFMLVWFNGFARVAPDGLVWFGLPFGLMCAHMLVGRLFVDAHQRRHTHYALTDERVLMVSGQRVRKVHSVRLQGMPEISLEESSNGRGTITFGPRQPKVQFFIGYPQNFNAGGQAVQSTELDSLPGARLVYEAIREAQARRMSSSSI